MKKALTSNWLKKLKKLIEHPLDVYPTYDKKGVYKENSKLMWDIPCDLALPCATQNELVETSVQKLINNHVLMISEGANMPTTKKGIDLLRENKILFGPAKAANAGGVLVSGLEISQNSQFYSYSYEKS